MKAVLTQKAAAQRDELTLAERREIQKQNIRWINHQSWIISPIVTVAMVIFFVIVFWR